MPSHRARSLPTIAAVEVDRVRHHRRMAHGEGNRFCLDESMADDVNFDRDTNPHDATHLYRPPAIREGRILAECHGAAGGLLS